MNRFTSLIKTLVFWVFIIMISSSLLSAVFLYIFYVNDFFPIIRKNPILLPFIGFIISTIIGTILTFPVGNRILKPLNHLIAATREVAKGNFNIKVQESKNKNQLSELIRSFNIMTQELSGIEMFRKDFINNFSHEFRTPMVSIRGFARQLQKNTLTAEQRKEYTDIIIKESERLTNMSSNILLLTKLEHQEIITDKNVFSLDEQLRDCILLLQGQWEKKNIKLQIQLAPIQYFSNEEMLSQVWLNLLSNAIKFSNEGGQITIKCCEASDYIKVKISDQGIGMGDETAEHIFEKFYQGDLAHASEGTGLGLSIVKRILHLCGGKFVVKSQLGKGTEIEVQLPKHHHLFQTI